LIFALLLSGIIQGSFLIFLLYNKGPNRIPNRILSFFILLVVFHLFLISLDVEDLFIAYPHFSRLSWLLPVLYGPLILLLTQSIVEIDFTFRRSHLLYAIPFLVYLGLLLPYFLSGTASKVAYLSDAVMVNQADFGWMNHVTNYLHIGFTSAALWFFYRNLSERSQYFSDDARVNIRWLQEFLWLLLGLMVFATFTFYAKKHQLPFFSGIYPSHFILVVVLVYWIAYKLLQEKIAFAPLQDNVFQKSEIEAGTAAAKYSKSGLNSEGSTMIAAQLQDLMAREKLYLNPGLTITELSDMMQIPKHQLSQAINAELGSNFFELINQYRLNEFKKQAVDSANSHLSILGIALECGFNSKATFNQVFKKSEGTTPSAYVKLHK
jgi:AraC-like DNA-binding protein